MVEKTVNICDVCKEKVAKGKCDVCNKDACEDCFQEKVIGSMVPFMKYHLCTRCEDIIQVIAFNEPGIFEEVLNNKPEIKQGIVEGLKNIIILKKISDDDIPSKKKKSPFAPILPTPSYPYNPPINPTRPFPPKNPYRDPFNSIKKYQIQSSNKKQKPVDDEFYNLSKMYKRKTNDR